MEIDLALILGAIGTAGTTLSVILAAFEIKDRLGAKSQSRETEVTALFQSVLPSLVLYDDQTTPSYQWEFLQEFKPPADERYGSLAVPLVSGTLYPGGFT